VALCLPFRGDEFGNRIQPLSTPGQSYVKDSRFQNTDRWKCPEQNAHNCQLPGTKELGAAASRLMRFKPIKLSAKKERKEERLRLTRLRAQEPTQNTADAVLLPQKGSLRSGSTLQNPVLQSFSGSQHRKLGQLTRKKRIPPAGAGLRFEFKIFRADSSRRDTNHTPSVWERFQTHAVASASSLATLVIIARAAA
jgi:hypothetical protein